MPFKARAVDVVADIDAAMATAATEKVPTAQVVRVLLPHGDADVRLASIDAAAGHLRLHQLSLDDSGEVEVGRQAIVKLASLGDAVAEGMAVLLKGGGPSGSVLLRLVFEQPDLAQTWATALRRGQHRGEAAANGVAADEVDDDAQLAARRQPQSGTAADANKDEQDITSNSGRVDHAMLSALITQQEEQVRLLEAINGQKDEQLTQLQQKLEDALDKLREGQEEYSRNQRTVQAQQQVIEILQGRHQVASAAEAACNLNAMATASGAAAAARAGASGPLAAMYAQAAGMPIPSTFPTQGAATMA